MDIEEKIKQFKIMLEWRDKYFCDMHKNIPIGNGEISSAKPILPAFEDLIKELTIKQ